ncbi:MAG TPA: phosphatidylserine decarboxylase family protein [Arsenophonus apicola]|uniref:phosphatidylserine decarboxylase family protein n=1 Tax=Arsenophonus TaxID=637 RepID=UPI001CDD3749|nr:MULTISPECIES: phosphatidylserine decarboxylase family protein [Arsenophonus]UBX29725.1 phosphatidylserine decarboxylase family protein [Arsenophonus apicola]
MAIIDKPSNKTYLIGNWMPSDQTTLANWMRKIIDKAEISHAPLLPSIQNLKDFIESNPKAYMFFNQMFDKADKKDQPAGLPQVRDYQHMLELFNVIMTHAPDFDETGLVGFPFNAILDWSMATNSGWSAFLDDEINHHLKAMLNEWAMFLKSPESTYVLNEDPKHGWLGEDAKKAMPTFVSDFKCDPAAAHYGFKSWDDFFTREFRQGVRPVAEPDNNSVIINACESSPYRLARNVKLRDNFWIKAQNYALQYMLDNDPLVDKFVGGTIYQAFLSALSYHRWHAPVSGKVIKTKLINGSYYSQAISMGFDPEAPNKSQGYINEVATRALIFIEADEPKIGLMCFMAVGMAEVSTCEIIVYEGQHITKGQEIGMFHFGGSTHCLIFRPEVSLEFDLHGQTPGLDSHNIPINSRIATVK